MTAFYMCATRGAWALLAFALLAAPSAFAQGRAPAGYVTSVDAPERDGRPGAILRREGQEVDVQIWTPLFDGDVLEIASGAVTIETAKDKRLVVDPARSPHRIEGELPTAGRFSAVSSVIGDLFRQKPSRNAATLIGRTGAPEIRMGGDAVQKVVTGQQVWLAWAGGAAPFTIEIIGQSRKRSLDIRTLATTTSESETALMTIPQTAAGKLTLVVRDAVGREASRKLVTDVAPAFPQWIAAGAPTREFEIVARALYLLEDKSGAHDMMAASIAAQAGDYPAAVNLLALLAQGGRP
ncbi:MAG: hypothetical protein K2Y29_18965 [Beijerinckiaceae bacterium]|nr:hypothetical protein [Beijerinckiaceae bacterium]